MEIYQLRTFLTVARVGHLTRAAEQLHVTQPAVSKQIKALEDELGVLLFERAPSGMMLTKAGQLLVPKAEKTLAGAMELMQLAQKMRGETTGSIQLGTIIDPEYTRLGQFLGKLLQYYPMIEVKLQHGISGWVMECIKVGELDAGFYLGKVSDPVITALELKVLNYLVVAPLQWSERVLKADWADLATFPWIGTPPHSSQHRLVQEMAHQHSLQIKFVIEVDQEASMINLVSTGVGLCLMREELAAAAVARAEVVIWPGTKIPCPLSFVYPAARGEDAVISALIKVLREVWV